LVQQGRGVSEEPQIWQQPSTVLSKASNRKTKQGTEVADKRTMSRGRERQENDKYQHQDNQRPNNSVDEAKCSRSLSILPHINQGGTAADELSRAADELSRSSHSNSTSVERSSRQMTLIVEGGHAATSICDQKGRCVYHPHIRLRKKSWHGGWKVLRNLCPDCTIENLKKDMNDKNSAVGPHDSTTKGDLRTSVHSSGSSNTAGSSRGYFAAAAQPSDGQVRRSESMPPMAYAPSKTERNVSSLTPSKKNKDRKARGMVVRQMEYTDVNGLHGYYTGTVNSDYFPHGEGTMEYDRGHRVEGVWRKGKWKRPLSE
jgi:hypothetical protein